MSRCIPNEFKKNEYSSTGVQKLGNLVNGFVGAAVRKLELAVRSETAIRSFNKLAVCQGAEEALMEQYEEQGDSGFFF